MNYRHRHGLHWKYKNLTLAFIGIILTIVLSRNEWFHSFLLNLNGLGYFGAFISGMLFVSTFTIATSALVLLTLAETLSPLEIGIAAGLGAVVGDILIFNLIKDDLANEIEDIYYHIDKKGHLRGLMHTKYFSWVLPVIGAVLIASPLPDELGISILGLSKMSTFKFILLSFILNFIGIFLVVSTSLVIKP